jgi:hypothetical protein
MQTLAKYKKLGDKRKLILLRDLQGVTLCKTDAAAAQISSFPNALVGSFRKLDSPDWQS